jgi:hypothetical protein
MHPVITQAFATERIRELHAHAAAEVRGRRLRRARRLRLFMGTPRAGHGAATPRLRGPRAA